jgi:hypothetical protein
MVSDPRCSTGWLPPEKRWAGVPGAEEETRIREWLPENQQETGEDSSAPSAP